MEAARRRTLSGRQLDVVRLAARGRGNAAIAEELSLSIETVKSHRRNIIARFGARNMTHACVMVAMNAPELLQ